MLKIYLCSLEREMIEAWKFYFKNDNNIEIYYGSIFDIECDAIVSPANSFGMMTGGLDYKISEFFGWDLQERLQSIIKTKYHGELLVGQAEIVETNHNKIQYLISAPTMRKPMIIKNTSNVYIAMRAILLLLKTHTFISKISIPALGVGTGKMSYKKCALQMKTSIDDFLYDKHDFIETWKRINQ